MSYKLNINIEDADVIYTALITSEDYLKILKNFKIANKFLDRDQKYLKKGKYRYFFTKNMPLDLQIDHIVDLVHMVMHEGNTLKDSFAVFCVTLAKLYKLDAFKEATKILFSNPFEEKNNEDNIQ